MAQGYEPYCLADHLFYDAPTRTRGDDVDFGISTRPPPPGWNRFELDDWLVYRPERAAVPAQGWKVHVSACLQNAEAILQTVFGYCIPRDIPFKFIRSQQLLLLRNGKYADRGSSGKFVTIFPANDDQLEVVLTELGGLLDGEPGPYILSDLRWGAGPLYVRYGGFSERYCLSPSGELALAITDDMGSFVPDTRGPTFDPPAWVTLPAFLNPHLEARNRATTGDLPYAIESALHFSNGGGLYSGVDQNTGERVVLKEARPYAGLDTDGVDAVGRLQREVDVLQRLHGLDVVPCLRDHFVLQGHHFLVEDFIDATPLNTLIVDRYPLIAHELDPTSVDDYTSWAVDVCGRVERAIDAIHSRGIVVGDLHPSNMLVQSDGRIVLIDFEVAGSVDAARRPTLADPGFMAPGDRKGFEIDRYALACLRLHLFLPLTNLLIIDRAKAEHLAEEIGDAFPVPPEFLSNAVRVIVGSSPRPGTDAHSPSARWPRLEPAADGWERLRDSMVQGIVASATPDRDDRLFPGDVKQFLTGGLNLAYGAAGVLYALAMTGASRQPEFDEWLVYRAMHPQPGSRLGFYDGLHGVAYALDCLGRRSEALKVLDICSEELRGRWERIGLDLFGGLAGIGLNLAHFATITGDPSLSAAADEVAEVVASRLGAEESVPELSGGEYPYAGLLRGSSGPALLFLRLHERTGDEALLDLARTALRQDLRRCYVRDDGALEVNEGWRSLPYIADGSVGMAMVLADYLAHRHDEFFAWAAASARKAAEAQFYVEPGLFYGRAGMILSLSRARRPGTAWQDPIVAGHIRRLSWHALRYQDAVAFPGEQLLRLSMDLATGTAGVLLAIGAALHPSAVHLPFLEPLESDSVRTDFTTTSNHEGR